MACSDAEAIWSGVGRGGGDWSAVVPEAEEERRAAAEVEEDKEAAGGGETGKGRRLRW